MLTSLFGGPNVIWSTPPKPAPYVPPTTISTRLPLPRSPIAPPTTVIGDPVITTATFFPGVTTTTASTPGGTGGTGSTGSGGTGTSDTSRLLDLFASQFQPQAVAPSLAPVSFTDTGTGTAPATGGMSAGLIVVAALVIAGIWWYMKHKAKP